MKNTKTPKPVSKKQLCVYTSFLVLLLFAVPSISFGQCIPGVSGFPSDFSVNDNDECTSIVTWTEPTYSVECDDFSGLFDIANWDEELNGNNGSVSTAGAPTTITIFGSGNGPNNVITFTDYCITVPVDGNINFDWTNSIMPPPGGAQLRNDEAAYAIDGVETILLTMGSPLGNNVQTESGTISDLSLTAGQEFCFRVRSNNRGAESMLDITNFSFEITEINQTSGPSNNSEQSIGDYDVEYTVTNCDGSTSTCDFTVTVSESIMPTVMCPADIMMNADTDRCTAVVCYDVQIEDNCEAILPDDIPGYNFIGSLNGHNYFTVDLGDALIWEDANAAASSIGGYLVSITSQEEQDFLIDNIPNGRYWIGLRYSPSLDEFKWVNGDPFMFEDWGPGQPGLIEGDYVFNLDFFGGFLDGWYDAPSLLPARYIVEIDTYEKELIAGLPAGSNFPVGETEVTYVGRDASGNTDTCSFNVIVFDNQAPEILDCPSDTIIQLVEEQCDTLVTFDTPLFTDNCPGATITQIEGLPSGSLFPIGVNVVTFEAVDTSGNADTCSFDIVVNEFIPNGLACKGEINFSVDEMTCSGSLTPSMLIDVTSVGCADSCVITIIEEDGTRRSADFTADDIGNTYQYEICCGGICCWGDVNVEYKFRPVIVCTESDTLSCTQSFDESVITPDISASCAETELITVDEVVEYFTCDTMFTAKMTTWYTAIDEYGNTSDTCQQTIYLERTNLDSITPVLPFALYNNSALDCGSGFATTSQGYPFPALSVTGAPRLRLDDGTFVDLYPFESNVICNGYAEYSDEILPGSTSCVTKIMRTFNIGEWWCSQTNEREFKQLIEVVDFTGPQVSCPSDVTISTSSHTCEGFISLDLPVVSDACNGNNIRIDLSAPTSPSGFVQDYDGRIIELPVGTNELTYRVYDDCGNRTDCSFTVTVRDDADPIAICDQFTAIGFGLEELTKVTAESIDDGSFDECGPVELSVARMDDPGFDDFTGFGPYVDITCDDVGNVVMVGLLVTDAGGNTNMCMVSVEVQDKIDAQFICPDDVTVECNFPFDPDNLGAFFGEVEIFDNCPSANTVNNRLVGDLNSCGAGTLFREISLINAQGVEVDFCIQEIRFEDGDPLTISDITPPQSEVTVTGCGPESIDPLVLGMPTVPDDDCQQVGIAMTNDTFPFTDNGACLKIIRTFSVIDWCIEDGPGSVLEPFEFVQTIKVNNTVAPEIEVFQDTIICSFEVDCGPVNVNNYLLATATDDCTNDNELLNRFEVRNSAGALVRFGNGLDASGLYNVDEYTVKFISEDKCGNQTFEESTFEVRSCKLPTPYCLQGLSTTLTAMDTTGDGTADVEMVMLTPEFFDAGSYHPCGYDITLSFSEDVNDTQVAFFCSDTLGLQEVELWVTDANGGQSYCTTFIDVQDNDTIDLCGGLKPVDIAGRLYTEMDAQMSNTEVELRSAETIIAMTDEDGLYAFPSMPIGGNYQIAPLKDTDYLNGVSTLDLVIIQRHILGISPLESPYKLIAADINNNEQVSASDLTALRKVILGIEESFPNNTSWRFIDAGYEFVNTSNPWETNLDETYNIFNLSEDMQVDFVAIKTGDVNDNVDMNVAAGLVSETRSNSAISFEMMDFEVESGQSYSIDVTAKAAEKFFGMQSTFNFDGLNVAKINAGKLNVNNQHISVDGGVMNLSYGNAEGVNLEEGDVLFSVVVDALNDGQLSDMISISEKGLAAEAYSTALNTSVDSKLAVSDLTIEWRESEAVNAISSFELMGNNPNPWRNTTELEFYLPEAGTVTMMVKDLSGRMLFNRTAQFGAGLNTYSLTNRDVEVSGLLIYELRYNDQLINGKMIKIE